MSARVSPWARNHSDVVCEPAPNMAPPGSCGNRNTGRLPPLDGEEAVGTMMPPAPERNPHCRAERSGLPDGGKVVVTWLKRLAAGVVVDPTTGCHVWQRARNGKGYGVLYAEGALHLAHRLAWRASYGSFPPAGLVLDHLCENRACCNPQHLAAVTNGQNIQRAYPRGTVEVERQRARWRQAQQAARLRRAAS